MPARRKKATLEQTRIHNTQLVLKTIFDQGPISRAAIARKTKLTRPTVSDAVARLVDDGLVTDVGRGPSTGGKSPTLLDIVDDARHLIGVDLGNNEFRGAVVNLRGQIQYQRCLPVKSPEGEAALEQVYELLDELVKHVRSPLLGIGIGTPGLIDPENGVVRKAVNLAWERLPLRQLLAQRYDVPIYVTNDSQIAAMAEFSSHAAGDSTNLVVIKAGRGIGAGIVIRGDLFYGDGFGAGEVGHTVLVEDGELCTCGKRGCLETLASCRAVIRQAQTAMQNRKDTVLHEMVLSPEEINLEILLGAMNRGDHLVQEIIAQAGNYLGLAVAFFVNIVNAQRVVIAGEMAQFGDALLLSVQKAVEQHALGTLAEGTSVEVSGLGDEIVILGASALVLSQELGII